MKKGTKLQYIGKGFLGFDPNYTEVAFICKRGFDLEVKYKSPKCNGKLLVRESEVKEI